MEWELGVVLLALGKLVAFHLTSVTWFFMSKVKYRRIYSKMQMEMESKFLGQNCVGKSRQKKSSFKIFFWEHVVLEISISTLASTTSIGRLT